ncbi:ATP-binding protein [Criibacterium bergeronii]|uniref:ATP-binding protein n=1 Tax=Criibacterium bergeronii TaxID=1871336 RepID=A0A552V6Z9_9FIRM|nr:ATP-binding protein [Criibacterium bergeronii]TRW26256.1 ATP-binding protein [Criibacterium bergeronii]
MNEEERKNLFDMFDDLAKREGSQSKACQKIGINAAIISTLKNGSYRGDSEKQYKILADYFKLKEEAKKSFKNDAYVPTSISEGVYSYIRNAQLKGGLIALAGSAGIGKTRAIRKYKDDNEMSMIFITSNPCLNTVKSVLKRLCKELNISGVRSNYEMYDSITEKLRDGMVIVFDEAQHLSLKAIETLRGFSDYFADKNQTLGIVFIGNETTMDRFGGKEDAVFAQIANRTIQKPIFKTTDITIDDIRKLYPQLEKSSMQEEFMLSVARSKEALRGANNLFTNAFDNEDISYEGLVKMAKHMKLMI